MAKKKKLKIDLGMILACVSVILAIVAICLLATPGATIKDTETVFTCANLTFGYTTTGEGLLSSLSVTYFNFSFMNLLPYILLVAGIVLTALSAVMKGLGKIFTLVATACFVIAGVLFFLMVTMCLPNEDSSIFGFVALFTNVKDGLVLGIGAIISGILAIVAGVANAVRLIVK